MFCRVAVIALKSAASAPLPQKSVVCRGQQLLQMQHFSSKFTRPKILTFTFVQEKNFCSSSKSFSAESGKNENSELEKLLLNVSLPKKLQNGNSICAKNLEKVAQIDEDGTQRQSHSEFNGKSGEL